MALNFTVSVYPDSGSPGYSDDATDPKNIDFYVILKAKLIVPRNTRRNQIPNKIQFRLQRSTVVTTEDGYLITSRSDSDAPRDADGDNREYTYRTFGQRSRTYRLNWNVTRLRGRWNISVQGQASNTVRFKIAKRQQIVHIAQRWAAVWPTLGISGPIYPRGAGGRRRPILFGDCGGFVSHIYGRVGLNISSVYQEANGQATAPDDREGSLRFFYTNPAVVLHVGILVGGGQIVDNNNAINDYPNNGVHLHGKDDGTIALFPNHRYDSVQDKTLRGTATLSILQQLDNE